MTDLFWPWMITGGKPGQVIVVTFFLTNDRVTAQCVWDHCNGRLLPSFWRMDLLFIHFASFSILQWHLQGKCHVPYTFCTHTATYLHTSSHCANPGQIHTHFSWPCLIHRSLFWFHLTIECAASILQASFHQFLEKFNSSFATNGFLSGRCMWRLTSCSVLYAVSSASVSTDNTCAKSGPLNWGQKVVVQTWQSKSDL